MIICYILEWISYNSVNSHTQRKRFLQNKADKLPVLATIIMRPLSIMVGMLTQSGEFLRNGRKQMLLLFFKKSEEKDTES